MSKTDYMPKLKPLAEAVSEEGETAPDIDKTEFQDRNSTTINPQPDSIKLVELDDLDVEWQSLILPWQISLRGV